MRRNVILNSYIQIYSFVYGFINEKFLSQLMKMLHKILHICLHDKPNPNAILNDLGIFIVLNWESQLTIKGFIY